MKNFYLLILCLSIFSCIHAQEYLPPAFEIKTDTIDYPTLDDAHWKMLEDPAGSFTIEQVSRLPLLAKFHSNTTKTRGIDYHVNTFWFCYRFKNNMPGDVKLTILEGDFYNAIEGAVFVSGPNGKWLKKLNGDAVPWSKRDDMKRGYGLNYVIKPGMVLTIYERKSFNYRVDKTETVQPVFGYTDRVMLEANKSHRADISDDSHYFLGIQYSFALGILLLAAVLNFLFYLIIRERVYLYFALFVILFGSASCYLILSDILFREQRQLFYYLSYNFIPAAENIFLLLFLRQLFNFRKVYPKWDKFLLFFCGLQALLYIAQLILPTSLTYKQTFLAQDATNAVIDLYILCMLGTLLFFIKRRDRATNLKVLAAFPLFLLWLFIVMIHFFAISYRYFQIAPPRLFYWIFSNLAGLTTVLTGCFILLFSWLLLQRFQILQKQIVQEALAKERLAKEKEIERNLLIEQQKVDLEKEVEERTSDLKQSLENLKSTQTQLIQSEKMASLGELTAGIAHEIQNPLNFVNNFSEVNREMIGELKVELKSGNVDEALAIADDIEQNEEKINHHGKRADGIVKGMLEHSRSGSGKKEPTDLNVMADEFMRLSYHGLRAKDRSFNAEMVTHFDPNLPKVNVSQQDMGRVMLNLFNNAFYAVNQKMKTAGADYKPEVTVTTFTPPPGGGGLGVKVKDNGVGIPDAIKDKIMQPFFTTKPTGEGTGLGLSLTYDMVVKGHGGSIQVDSLEGEGSEFTILLPVS